jgi:excisionase family DNA binding protein
MTCVKFSRSMKKEFTTKEAAEILGITDSRVRQMVLAGDIDHTYFGRLLVITQTGIVQAQERQDRRTRMFKTVVKRAA